MKKTFSGAETGTGAVYEWQGNDDVGSGKMTIVAVEPNERVDLKLEFIEPFASKADTTFLLAPEGEGTKVTWAMEGTNDFMGKAFSLVLDMDALVGADFEKGLGRLAKLAEAERARQEETPDEPAAEEASADLEE